MHPVALGLGEYELRLTRICQGSPPFSPGSPSSARRPCFSESPISSRPGHWICHALPQSPPEQPGLLAGRIRRSPSGRAEDSPRSGSPPEQCAALIPASDSPLRCNWKGPRPSRGPRQQAPPNLTKHSDASAVRTGRQLRDTGHRTSVGLLVAGVGPVHQRKIHIVHAEGLHRATNAPLRLVKARAVVPDFGGDENFLPRQPAALETLPNLRFVLVEGCAVQVAIANAEGLLHTPRTVFTFYLSQHEGPAAREHEGSNPSEPARSCGVDELYLVQPVSHGRNLTAIAERHERGSQFRGHPELADGASNGIGKGPPSAHGRKMWPWLPSAE
eukprot:scaffold1110_cov254-Pinguiococcus_pyrenoidosus.AAC.3